MERMPWGRVEKGRGGKKRKEKKNRTKNGKATVDNEEVLQSQQPTLCGNKAPSPYSTLTSKPKHERYVHFHSHYKPQIYFNNMGELFRACKLQRQTVSVAFQRQTGRLMVL